MRFKVESCVFSFVFLGLIEASAFSQPLSGLPNSAQVRPRIIMYLMEYPDADQEVKRIDAGAVIFTPKMDNVFYRKEGATLQLIWQFRTSNDLQIDKEQQIEKELISLISQILSEYRPKDGSNLLNTDGLKAVLSIFRPERFRPIVDAEGPKNIELVPPKPPVPPVPSGPNRQPGGSGKLPPPRQNIPPGTLSNPNSGSSGVAPPPWVSPEGAVGGLKHANRSCGSYRYVSVWSYRACMGHWMPVTVLIHEPALTVQSKSTSVSSAHASRPVVKKKQIEEFVDDYPRDAEECYLRGKKAFLARDIPTARAYLAQAVRLEQNDARFWYFKSFAESAAGNGALAANSVTKARALHSQELPSGAAIENALLQLPENAQRFLDSHALPPKTVATALNH